MQLFRKAALPDNYDSVIRATIYAHSRKAYVPGNPDVFFKAAKGTWGVRPDWEDRMPKAHAARKRISEYLEDVALARLPREEILSLLGDPANFRAVIRRKAEELRSLAE